jgi:hypothetical protein
MAADPRDNLAGPDASDPGAGIILSMVREVWRANVLHNWGDEEALRILRNVRSAMAADGRLLLVDALIPDDDRPHFAKDLDARLLSMFGAGRERSESEYFGLLDAAGFRATRSGELAFELSLIEAAPRPPP